MPDERTRPADHGDHPENGVPERDGEQRQREIESKRGIDAPKGGPVAPSDRPNPEVPNPHDVKGMDKPDDKIGGGAPTVDS